MLIDRYLPRYDVRSRHETHVDAPPEVAYRAARELNLAGGPISKVLFGLRTLPRLLTGDGLPPLRRLGLDQLEEAGVSVLGEEPGEEIVLGVVGRFWKPNSDIHRVEPEHFTTFDKPGFAKAAINLRVRPRTNGSLVTTETRVLCTDAAARRTFRLYWTLIGPFSGLIRVEILRSIRTDAERSAQTVGSS